ncbi:MAG: carbamoyl-phosphate synthase large subunit, partial [Oscillospiraceae bacterium]|nr:carbamoyl-phosphate synthase large subunit [Oscillospiraceae bacterium]
MNSILVTAIGSYAAKLAISGLRKNGYRVIGTDIYPAEWVAEAKNVEHFRQVPKAAAEKEFREAMLKICKEDNVCGIIPLTDVEIDFFQNNRSVFEEQGVQLFLSPYETIALCRDKMRLNRFVDEHCPGVKTIPTAWASDYTEDPPAFPAICKIVDGRSSQGLYRIQDRIDWEYFRKREDAAHYLVQPMIEGSVIAVDCLRDTAGH